MFRLKDDSDFYIVTFGETLSKTVKLQPEMHGRRLSDDAFWEVDTSKYTIDACCV